jgi:uncharacterized membrane protein
MYLLGDEVVADIKWWILVGIIAAYAIYVVSAYFYKQAFEILASTTAHNLFRIVGLLIFIGAIITRSVCDGSFADVCGSY